MTQPNITDQQFWELIDHARAGSPSSADPDGLAKLLTALSDEQILDFGHMFREKICDLNDWRLWGAGFVIAGGMGDDSFHYFRSWIVGKGKQVFDLAMKNPDDLGPFIDDPEVDNELLEYVTVDILEDRNIEEDPRDRCDRDADGDPTGVPFDERTVGASFPKLSAQFG
jgi:hypothetical protein